MIFFDNFPGTVTNCEAIQFADDSIIFVSDKNVDDIEWRVKWRVEKSLFAFCEIQVRNFKAHETECMLLGMSTNVSTLSKPIKVVL